MIKVDPSECDRQFYWISSITGDAEVLSRLNEKMSQFYGKTDGRELYQKMLNTIEESSPSENSLNHSMPNYICALKPDRVLEIGCADARMYRQLSNYGYTGDYIGMEVADYIIQQNKKRHPEASWECGNAYEIPFPDNYFDICFSFYVLEHLVYPERGLIEMLRVIKPNGRLVLVFPDFVEARRFPSQLLGFSPINTASKKLRKGKVIDATVSLYDSRIRLPAALKNAVANCGPFPVNTRPICLYYPSIMGPDIDAIYVASKTEVRNWAITNGYKVEYPYGIQDIFCEHAFIAISK